MHDIKNIIDEIIIYLEKNVKTTEEQFVVNSIKKCAIGKKTLNNITPNLPPKHKPLINGLLSISSKKIIPLKKSILKGYNKLYWKTDDGEYYEKNSSVGRNYLNGNMNTELIGPNDGFFKSDKLKLGIFFLEQKIFYKDHKHPAPELYLNLTDGTKWRFGEKKWLKKKPGSIIYNSPNNPHGMKVGEIPFVSIWCWPKNHSQKCIVINNNP